DDYPVSLLDDITSELDSRRQRLLLNLVQNQSQVFLTTTQPSLFESSLSEDTYLYQVKTNQVRKQG
ncbi:DNA replication and repair protein RecF, partial [Candidatus Aerophobetes bacterium]|nr:DNA replication and repair protein RecF [Candidatus Aerophobetes bacterium]